MNNKEQENYLISKGWTKSEVKYGSGKISYAYDIENRFRGGLSLDYAVKVQNQYDIIDEQGICYLAVRDNHGYGYKIRYFTDKAKENYKTSNFTHLTEEDAKKLVGLFNNGIKPENIEVPRQEFDLIAIFEEKHSTRYFIVPTFEDLCKVALKIFKERDEEECRYDYSDSNLPEPPDIPKENIDKLKNETLKRAAQESWVRYENEIKYQKESLKEKELYNKTLNDKTGEIALQFLKTRKDSEYEEWEIIESEDY